MRRGLREAGLADALVPAGPRRATREELLRVHAPEHVDLVTRSAGRRRQLDADTVIGPLSTEAALLAAGAAVEAVSRVLDGSLDRAFCALRPPGHHATRERAMGFCLFNNVAVAAAAALAGGVERVAVVDFDVHHGNGTQEIFEASRRVLFVSSHQFPLYPGTGALGETGHGEGEGFTVNLPLPAGWGDAEYEAVYRSVVVPVGRAFDPQLLLVSAGFDPATDDPLANMDVSPGGFARLMDCCLEIASGAAGGRVVVLLEGGYDLDSLARGTAAVAARLLDRAVPAASPKAPDPRCERLLAAVAAVHGARWPVRG